MTADNILYATNSVRSSLTSLKKKLTNMKVSIEFFDAEIEKLDTKLDNVLTQSDIYKSKLERELGREVRRLEKELSDLRKSTSPGKTVNTVSSEEREIATTISIIEAILRWASEGAEDFRLASESFLFPAVIERVLKGDEEAYYLEKVPATAHIIVQRGKDYVKWLRESCETHITTPEAWNEYSPKICDWWRNDALPLLYSSRDEQWDIDVPLSLREMLEWRNNLADRPVNLPLVYDAYQIYWANNAEVFESSGVREFELSLFSFPSSQ